MNMKLRNELQPLVRRIEDGPWAWTRGLWARSSVVEDRHVSGLARDHHSTTGRAAPFFRSRAGPPYFSPAYLLTCLTAGDPNPTVYVYVCIVYIIVRRYATSASARKPKAKKAHKKRVCSS